MARRLILVRHAAALIPAGGQAAFTGSTDAPLSAEGRKQCLQLAPAFRSMRPTRCWSSPLLRASQTAELIAAGSSLVVEAAADLREVDFGLWEGKTFNRIAAEFPAAANEWADFSPEFQFPEGESIAGFLSRVWRAADAMASDPADVVAAVTHGGPIRAIICRLLGLPAKNYLLFDVRLASCAVIDFFDGHGVLSGLNLFAPPPEAG